MVRSFVTLCALLFLFLFTAELQAQYIITPNCPNGLCPRIQQAIPAAFPPQPLIQIGQPIQGYWTTPGVQPWAGPIPLSVPAPMPGPLAPPSPSPTPTPTPTPGPVAPPSPLPTPATPGCKPILFPNFQPFGGRFRLSCRCQS